MTKKEIFESGADRGRCIASWQDLPEIGTVIKPFTLPEFEGEIEDVGDAKEVFMSVCWESEENSREFSPFEFTAKDLNDLNEKKPYETWDVYEDGIYKGFIENWNSRVEYYED